MKRRTFLLGLLAAPAAPILPAVAQPMLYGGMAGGSMADLLLAQAEKAINPPVIVDGEILTAAKVAGYNDAWLRQYANELAQQLDVHAVLHDYIPVPWRKP